MRQASAGSTIAHSDLADLLDMPNPRDLNYVLGSMGQTLQDLEQQRGEEIPPIQCMGATSKTAFRAKGGTGS